MCFGSFVYGDVPKEVTSDVEKTTRHDCHLGPGFDMFNMELHLHRLLLSLSGTTNRAINDFASEVRGNLAGDEEKPDGFIEVVENGEEADFFYVPVYPNLYMCSMAARNNRTFDKRDYAAALDIGKFIFIFFLFR
jgi:hypothetical protein